MVEIKISNKFCCAALQRRAITLKEQKIAQKMKQKEKKQEKMILWDLKKAKRCRLQKDAKRGKLYLKAKKFKFLEFQLDESEY